MHLTDLKPAPGAKRDRKVVGRGHGSGHGKTSTRGANGQGQRSGESRKRGFEGGQMPLYRRLPKKKQFFIPGRLSFVTLNVGILNHLPAGTEVTPEYLLANGFLRHLKDGLRLLGAGELSVALTVKAKHVTVGARQKIEAAGGTVELL